MVINELNYVFTISFRMVNPNYLWTFTLKICFNKDLPIAFEIKMILLLSIIIETMVS